MNQRRNRQAGSAYTSLLLKAFRSQFVFLQTEKGFQKFRGFYEKQNPIMPFLENWKREKNAAHAAHISKFKT